MVVMLKKNPFYHINLGQRLYLFFKYVAHII